MKEIYCFLLNLVESNKFLKINATKENDYV